jgi:hypothetical protein
MQQQLLQHSGPSWAVDVDGQLQAQSQCGSSAAVLVRPDGHIAWMSDEGAMHMDGSIGSTASSSSSSKGGSREGEHLSLQQQVLKGVLSDVLHLIPQQPLHS